MAFAAVSNICFMYCCSEPCKTIFLGVILRQNYTFLTSFKLPYSCLIKRDKICFFHEYSMIPRRKNDLSIGLFLFFHPDCVDHVFQELTIAAH